MKMVNKAITDTQKELPIGSVWQIRQYLEHDLNSFGEKLEQGWKDDIDPNKLALQMIPMGQTYKLYRWGN